MPDAPPRPAPVRLFHAVTVGHFGIDVFNSMTPVLAAFLKAPLGLSAAQVGLAVGIHQLLAGATQPPFGWVEDRVGSRILGPLSVAWAISLMCAALIVGWRYGYLPFLGLLAVAALGSGAFHPQGVAHAGAALPGRSATATSVFFLSGQLGLSTGPVVAGVMLDRAGPSGIVVVGALFLTVPLYMTTVMGRRSLNPPPAVLEQTGSIQLPPAWGPRSLRALTLLAAIFSLRAWIFIGTVAFLPLLFQVAGWSASGQGLAAGIFWVGGAIGGVLAGVFADRYGRRFVVSASTFGGALMLPVLPIADGALALLVCLLCGAFLGAPHSVLMVVAQDLLPVRRALASGLSLGFLFAMGAVGSWGIGALADRHGLVPMIQAGAIPALAVSALALLLPRSAARKHEGLLVPGAGSGDETP
ncbi:MAG TPA: MFS transporter [Thermoanaerobaculia bacterium]|nr:MFS transporter [Thermoanaerobaculia bacterium]